MVPTPRVSSMDNTNCRRFRSQFSDRQTPTNLAILVELCEKIHNMKLLQPFLQYTGILLYNTRYKPNNQTLNTGRSCAENSSKHFKGRLHRVTESGRSVPSAQFVRAFYYFFAARSIKGIPHALRN